MDQLQGLPHWLRWILVLPAAVVAWFGVQLFVIIGGLLSGNEWPDWTYQLINSALSGYALVAAAAWMAPRGKLVTAILLTILNSLTGVWLLNSAVGQSGQQSDEWLLLAGAGILSIIGGGAACYAAWEADRERRSVQGFGVAPLPPASS